MFFVMCRVYPVQIIITKRNFCFRVIRVASAADIFQEWLQQKTFGSRRYEVIAGTGEYSNGRVEDSYRNKYLCESKGILISGRKQCALLVPPRRDAENMPGICTRPKTLDLSLVLFTLLPRFSPPTVGMGTNLCLERKLYG